MSRPPSLQFQFPGMADVAKKPARQPIGEHLCEVCGQPAPFGYEVSYLRNKPGRWRCRDHRIKDQAKGEAA